MTTRPAWVLKERKPPTRRKARRLRVKANRERRENLRRWRGLIKLIETMEVLEGLRPSGTDDAFMYAVREMNKATARYLDGLTDAIGPGPSGERFKRYIIHSFA